MPLDILAEMKSEDLQAHEHLQELLLFIEGANILHAFFEGDSDKYYYSQRIYDYTKAVKFITCGSKKRVKQQHTTANKNPQRWASYKFAFFIDLDFDAPYTPAKNDFPIFETPCYSVENFYVSAAAFEQILARKLYITAVEVDYKIALNAYIKLQNDFHAAILPFMAYIVCLRDIERNISQERIKLPEPKFINKLINFDWVAISATLDYNKLIADFFIKDDSQIKISAEALASKKAYLATKQPSQHFRGKYELHFLFKYLSLLFDSSKNKEIFTKQIPSPYSISTEVIMKSFAECADTPATLTNYLRLVCQ